MYELTGRACSYNEENEGMKIMKNEAPGQTQNEDNDGIF